jgi:hypothetical protein
MELENKKGMLFTLTVVALLSLFLASYGVFSYVKDRGVINNRIDTMNNFVFSIEEDLIRKFYISGFRIIFLFEKEIAESGNYISSFNSSFEEAFFNGTINGEGQDLLEKVIFEDIEDFFNEKGSKINVNVSLLNPKIFVEQSGPWEINFSVKMDLIVEDKSKLAFWNRTILVSSYIPIEGFEDPFYIVNTNGLVVNKINKTIYVDFINGSDVSNLEDHLFSGYYINSTLAPSFLNRLSGINSPSINGIESLVDLEILSNQGMPIKDKSVVDYIYFSEQNPSTNAVSGMPFWFKLDDSHVSIYS